MSACYPHTDNMATRSAGLVLAENLQQLMDHRGLSQAELARQSGVAQRTISTLLDKADPVAINPRMRTIEQIAGYFGMPVWLLLIPDMQLEMALSKQFARSVEAQAAAREAGGQAPPDAVLLAKSLETAMAAFRNNKRVPTDQHLAAAAAYVYAHVSTGRRMKDAEKEVRKLLEKAGDSAPSFADLH